MIDIYCHIHTPINIEEEKFFLDPIIFKNTLYLIKEKKLHDILLMIGYFQEYIRFTRENGYENLIKWLVKKNLLNEGFLEAVSQYQIEDIHLKQVYNYKSFQKNDFNKPIVSEEYLKNILQKVLIYNHLKENQDEFNEKAEKELNIIENELSFIKDEKALQSKQSYYQNNIFKFFLDNFFLNIDIEERLNEINNIKFSCDTLLNYQDLCVYKISSIKDYKNFNFKLINNSHKECLRENSFVKLYADFKTGSSGDNYLRSLLNELKTYSQVFTNDKVDFGIAHLKKIIYSETHINKIKTEAVKNQKNENGNSNLALLNKTQTIISETEDHIISRYNSLKNYTNIYFAPEDEMITLISVLNMNNENLKRINSLLWGKSEKIETELIKFIFKKGNLPYSAYGFASLNF